MKMKTLQGDFPARIRARPRARSRPEKQRLFQER
jgi:hypothetical protein